MKKNKRIDYYSFNKGTLILLMGLALFLFNLFYKLIFLGASTEIIYYLQLISFALIYLGFLLHFIFIGDKPFFKSLNYIKKSKDFIYIVIAVFLFSALMGFFITPPEVISEKILEFIKELLAQTEGMSAGELIRFIFFNNLRSTFFAMILGILLGIFPVLTAFANGYLLGFVSSLAVREAGFFELWRLFPHGIFELPAVFISVGLGLKLGTFIFQKKRLAAFREYLFSSVKVFFYIIIPLLVIAAVIEGLFVYLS